MKAGFERIGRSVPLVQAQRGCLDKRRYGSRNKARDAAAAHQARWPEWRPERPYRCTLCGGFHLTSSPVVGGQILTKRAMP